MRRPPVGAVDGEYRRIGRRPQLLRNEMAMRAAGSCRAPRIDAR
jgi:hypothetical protein